jgi:acylphosphatase
MKKKVTIHISGRVQGVFFRASTKAKAEELGVFGYVQNESDGSVYIEAEGEENVLEDFIAWCKRGPELAQVTNCAVKSEEVRGYRNFIIYR